MQKVVAQIGQVHFPGQRELGKSICRSVECPRKGLFHACGIIRGLSRPLPRPAYHAAERIAGHFFAHQRNAPFHISQRDTRLQPELRLLLDEPVLILQRLPVLPGKVAKLLVKVRGGLEVFVILLLLKGRLELGDLGGILFRRHSCGLELLRPAAQGLRDLDVFQGRGVALGLQQFFVEVLKRLSLESVAVFLLQLVDLFGGQSSRLPGLGDVLKLLGKVGDGLRGTALHLLDLAAQLGDTALCGLDGRRRATGFPG